MLFRSAALLAYDGLVAAGGSTTEARHPAHDVRLSVGPISEDDSLGVRVIITMLVSFGDLSGRHTALHCTIQVVGFVLLDREGDFHDVLVETIHSSEER